MQSASHAAALLSDNPDSYFISPCKEEKWVIVQLSAEAVLDAVQLVNYEFYSSTTHEFELLGSHRKPKSEYVLPNPTEKHTRAYFLRPSCVGTKPGWGVGHTIAK